MSTAQMKRHLFYSFLSVFLATAVITLLGITGAISIPDFYLKSLTGALLIELVGAVIGIYRGANFFKEDDSRNGQPGEVLAVSGVEVQKTKLPEPAYVSVGIPPDAVSQVQPALPVDHPVAEPFKGQRPLLASALRELESARSFSDYLSKCEREIPAAELDEKVIFNRFHGLQVSWALEVDSIKLIENGFAEISAIDFLIRVNSGPISTELHPEIKFLKKGQKIVITGCIKKIFTKFLFSLEKSEIISVGSDSNTL